MTLKDKLQSFCTDNLNIFLPTTYYNTALSLAKTGFINSQKIIPLAVFSIPLGFDYKAITIVDLLFFDEFLTDYKVEVRDNMLKMSSHEWKVNISLSEIISVSVSFVSGSWSYTIVTRSASIEMYEGDIIVTCK